MSDTHATIEPKRLNPDTDDRDRLIEHGSDLVYGSDGVGIFEDLTVDTVEELLKRNFVDENDGPLGGPNNGTVLDFLRHNSMFNALGFVTKAPQAFSRLVLTGVEFRGKATRLAIGDFVALYRLAPDFSLDIGVGKSDSDYLYANYPQEG